MAEQKVAEVMAGLAPFEGHVAEEYRFTNDQLHTLQINIGYKCNLACRHCHLECGPNRAEMMSRETLEACLDAYETGGFTSLDITGGAPEMHPDYRWFLGEVNKRGIKPICRTNLCILTEPEYAGFIDLYARYDVTLVASLPSFSARNADKIRGQGVFDASIEALRKLNEAGFGTGKHAIMLVYNPAGPVLPPAQASLERDYKERLSEDFGVTFDALIAIANNPSGRFAERLAQTGRLDRYMDKLIGAFNPSTCAGMMCRDQVSVDWQGKLYDCDFNQALGMEVETGETIFDLAKAAPKKRRIVFGNHCYGCTAGSGSSCGGATA